MIKGKTYRYDESAGKAIFAGYLIKFKTIESELLPLFLELLTKSTDYKNWISKTRGGTSQPNINAQQFASYLIPLVEPSAQLKAVDKYKALKNKLYKNLVTYNESISKAFEVIAKYLN